MHAVSDPEERSMTWACVCRKPNALEKYFGPGGGAGVGPWGGPPPPRRRCLESGGIHAEHHARRFYSESDGEPCRASEVGDDLHRLKLLRQRQGVARRLLGGSR